MELVELFLAKEMMRWTRGLHGALLMRWSVLLASALFILIVGPRQAEMNSPASNTSARPELVLQTGHTTRINAVVFSPDGKWIASGGSDNQIKIWDISSGRELRSLNGHTGWVKSLAVSSDGLWLASGSNDRTIKVWNVLSGEAAHSFAGHAGPIESLAFSSNGRWL